MSHLFHTTERAVPVAAEDDASRFPVVKAIDIAVFSCLNSLAKLELIRGIYLNTFCSASKTLSSEN